MSIPSIRTWRTLLATFVASFGVAALVSVVAWPTGAQAAGDAAAGKTAFETNCASCHGATGKGDGPVGAALNPPPRDFTKGEFKFDADKNGTAGEDTDLKMVIKNGAAAYGGSPLMAPWGHLPDAEVDNLIAYVRSLKQ